jgi:hypothetical protein
MAHCSRAAVGDVTLSGLVGSVTASTDNLGVTSTPSGTFAGTGVWTNAGGTDPSSATDAWENVGGSGTLVINLASGGTATRLLGCQDYEIEFTVKNPSEPQSPALMSVEFADVIAGVYDSTGSVMSVDDVAWTSLSVSDTSNYPCVENTVTVSMVPSITLYASCVRFVEFSGFTGTMTSDQTLTLSNSNTELATSATWIQDAGTIRVDLVADLVMGTAYSFDFLVRCAEDLTHCSPCADIYVALT